MRWRLPIILSILIQNRFLSTDAKEQGAVMTSYNPRLAVTLGIALSFSSLLTACNKSAPPSEQASKPADQSAPAPAPAPLVPPSQPAPQPETAQPASSPAPVPPAPPVPRILPAGTSFSTRISSTLSSKTSNAGDSFSGTLVKSVSLNGSVVIPAGSSVNGVIAGAHSAGKFKGAATLSVRLVSVNVRGRTYPVQTALISQETKGKGKRTGAMVGGGAAGGALIGGVAGGGKGALIGGLAGAGTGTAGAAMTGNNRDIEYPAETVLPFHLSSSLNLGPGAAEAAQQP
jgi:hypothetical protein